MNGAIPSKMPLFRNQSTGPGVPIVLPETKADSSPLVDVARHGSHRSQLDTVPIAAEQEQHHGCDGPIPQDSLIWREVNATPLTARRLGW